MMLGEQGTDTGTKDSSFISPKRIAILIVVSIIVFALLGMYGDPDEVLQALSTIPWYWVLPLMMILSFMNYIFRYLKWQYFLHRIDVHISHIDSFRIFLAGFTLTTTPGKIGEAIKGYFVQEIDGTPVVKTIPIVVSERVTDLLAIMILALVGFTLGVNAGDQLLTVLLLGGVVLGGAIVVGSKTFYRKFLSKLTSIGPLKRFQDHCDVIENTMTRTLNPRSMLLTTAISIPGWFMECLELWILLAILSGGSYTLSLLLVATFVHATASIIGALTFTPGGVGTYEGSSVFILTIILSFTDTVASAATILIRFMTLWFSVIIGFISMSLITRKIRKVSEATQQA
jgi:uncharacterized protein (TIRG00374 family)